MGSHIVPNEITYRLFHWSTIKDAIVTELYGNNLYFAKNPVTGMILAYQHIGEEGFSGIYGIRYAFLGSDGKVLPDVEYCGEIITSGKKSYELLDQLMQGFNSDARS